MLQRPLALRAGAAPIIYGLLSDLFPPRQRAYVTTFVALSQGAGAAVGQAVAGGISGIDWRLPFVLVSAPALIVAAITALTTRDPPRGGAEPALKPTEHVEGFHYEEHLSWRKLAELCRTRTNVLVILQVRLRVGKSRQSRHCLPSTLLQSDLQVGLRRAAV